MTSEEQLSYLKEFIGNATAKEIRDIEKKADEANLLREQLKLEKDKNIKLNNEIQSKIDNAVRFERLQAERDKQQTIKDYKYNTQSKKIKPLEQEKSRLEHQLSSLSQEHKEIVALLKEQSALLNKILDIVSSSETVEEIRDKVNKVNRPSKEQIVYECKEIYRLLHEGKTNKEIADILYTDQERRYVKVSERKRSKTYKELFG